MESIQPSGVTPTPVDQNAGGTGMTQLESDWQASTRSLRERSAVMLKNDLLADVYFTVGSDSSTQRRIPAHKYILVTGSSVFYAMFCGSLAEETKEITIPDVEPQAFTNLLKYLYCDEISLEADTALPTLYAAKKYIMPHLAQLCVEYLETKVDVSNACLLLRYSRLFGETELMERCLNVIDTQAHDALQSDNFTGIDYQTLEQILGRDSIRADETVVFKAAVCWAEAECTRQGRDTSPQQCREVLGDALYLLRFPVMTPSDFADGACQSGLLSKQEIIDIFLYFTAKKNKPYLRFSTDSRMPRTPPHCCLRFPDTRREWGYSGRCESIQFSVDKAICVAGFGLYGSCKGDTEYHIDMTLEYNGVVLRQKHHDILCDGSTKTVHVLFDSPFRIEPNKYYTAMLVVKNPTRGYYGCSGISHVTCDDLNFTFTNSNVNNNGTRVVHGQIPEILFYR